MHEMRQFYYMYVAAFYTTIEFVSTIGYGDITPVSVFNTKLFMVYQLLGVAIFPLVMQKMQKIVENYKQITLSKFIASSTRE